MVTNYIYQKSIWILYYEKIYSSKYQIQFFSVISDKTNLEKALEITNNSYFIGILIKKYLLFIYKDGFVTYA